MCVFLQGGRCGDILVLWMGLDFLCLFFRSACLYLSAHISTTTTEGLIGISTGAYPYLACGETVVHEGAVSFSFPRRSGFLNKYHPYRLDRCSLMGRDCFVRCRMCRNTLCLSVGQVVPSSSCDNQNAADFDTSPWDNAILPPLPGESRDHAVICLNLSFGNPVKISIVFVFPLGLGSYSPAKNIHSPAQQHTELLISWEPVGKGTLRASV